MEAIQPDAFRKLVESTKVERAHVRRLVASGLWQQAERDSNRFREFAAKRFQNRGRSGAEAQQGDTLDYQPASFLSEGATIRRAVAYVEVTFGARSTIGTGFLVSPRLFLTNQHVILNAQAAMGATITFDRELDELGRPRPTTSFTLDAASFALFSDEPDLDYALVALGPRLSGEGDISDFGFCPLSNAPDKHVVGMSTNIIQHPEGQRKLITIRKNTLVARTPRTLLYETDTEVGSSGSPVFNDDWEVVALHHYGEPFLERVDDQGKPIPLTVNEGIRISALVNDLAKRRVDIPAAWQPLLDQALELGVQASASSAAPKLGQPKPKPKPLEPRPESLVQPTTEKGAVMNGLKTGTAVEIVIPLRISVSLDGTTGGQVGMGVTPPAANPAAPSLGRRAEAVRVDTDYANRSGYDPTFIPGTAIPLPDLKGETANSLAPLRAGEADAAEGELKYEHFSVKMNRFKQMAIFTATNIDGETYLAVDRKTGEVSRAEGETWFRDPRISESFFLNQDFYSAWSSYFDRGHLTRRTDPTWGSDEEAVRANADTFHFTNCSPQHFRFNQTTKFWQGVERYVLETGILAQDSKRRMCVFQGPIFDDSIDRTADDVQIPSSFFKVVVWRGKERLKAVGLVVDQSALLDEARVNLGLPRSPSFVNVNHWRVAIKTIEKRTGLDFGQAVRDADTVTQSQQPGAGAEALQGTLIHSLADIAL
ncbi:DNA/RNA non-specific endonuclease [Variovorax sp. RT4R15]|uniref:DNA/RNA non-specific endonuclease n=1 Tax=Variovorax sp. RT4R15 TaxID=3443737 RepID=UPI003F47B4B5